jgi:hypothetical protein
MKITLLINLLIGVNFVYAINLSGKYLCNGYDTKDGPYSDDYVTLTQVKNHSYPEKDVYSYNFMLSDSKGALQYSGFATSHGRDLAIYFENMGSKKNPNDRGVGIAKVNDSIVRNSKGQFEQSITFSKFFFEPNYTSDGSEFCKKV